MENHTTEFVREGPSSSLLPDILANLQIRKEQVRLLYTPSLNAAYTSTFVACALAYIQWSFIDHDIILIWLACMSLVIVARVGSYFSFFRKDIKLQKIIIWEKFSVYVTTYAAILWGAAAIFLFPEGNFERQAATTVLLAGISSGAVTTLSALRKPIFIFLSLTMLPLSIHLFIEATDLSIPLAILCLVYTTFLVTSANHVYEAHLQNISLRIKSGNEEQKIRRSEEAVIKTSEILQMIATGDPADNIYDAIALMYEKRHPGIRCSLLRLQGNKLFQAGAPSLPKEYCTAINGLENGPNIGSCGTSTFSGKQVLVEDIATDPKWTDIKEIALPHGLRSCWSEPIKDSSGSVLGAFGMYRNYPALPTEEEAADLAAAARLSSIIMAREQTKKQHRELEIQLRQKHKIEAIGVMAGGIAHNFNNNLSIILGNIELSQMKQPSNSDVTPLLENAKIAIWRSRDLVKKIITYSSKGEQNKTPIQLSEIVSETVALVQSTLPTTVNIEQVISPECDSVVVNADATQIQEVLVNLCNNAVHAMDERGVLKILLQSVELTQQDMSAQYEQPSGRYAKLSVQDSGSGMSSEMVDKIFDPFFTTKEEHEGAGMGLATVQGIVVQHGGLIKVDSAPGQGTEFDLYFPIVDAKRTEPALVNTEFFRGTEQILFVDDDEMLASLGGELLTEIGYQVSVMTDSTEALKTFTTNADHFDLVITDQTMPDLCGKDLILELKKVKPDIPTILCTGFSSKIDDVHAAELGINAFLMKPLNLSKLSQTVRRVLGESTEGEVSK